MNFLYQRFRTLSSDRHIQTDRQTGNYIPRVQAASRVVKYATRLLLCAVDECKDEEPERLPGFWRPTWASADGGSAWTRSDVGQPTNGRSSRRTCISTTPSATEQHTNTIIPQSHYHQHPSTTVSSTVLNQSINIRLISKWQNALACT